MFHSSDNRYKCQLTRNNEYGCPWDITIQCYQDVINLAPPLYSKVHFKCSVYLALISHPDRYPY